MAGCWRTGWAADGLAGWLAAWLDGWLAPGWRLAGWLDGWLGWLARSWVALDELAG